jgi:mono/diheme cytochrome c family protein
MIPTMSAPSHALGRWPLLVVALVASLASVDPASAQPSAAEIERGKYIFGATGGCGCHTEQIKEGGTARLAPINAGGRRYDGPFGTVYATNITPDRQTGIGSWTDDQIIAAIRLGRRPNGERLLPVHPYTVFNGMAESDLKHLVAFLRTVPPVNKQNQPKRITVPLFESVFLPAWLAAFSPRETPPASAPTSGVPRGEYLVRAVSHCGECHTPRTRTHAVDNSRFLAGNPNGPENSEAPNLTPDPQTGLTWSVAEIAEYLGTGNKPDGDVAGSLMRQVIDGTAAGYKDLTQADRTAIAQYLKSIPPVTNRLGK